MLKLSNVRLQAAVEDTFEHTFAAGEIAVVLGANNAGKTDLCRLIAGLDTRARGDIQLDGEPLHGMTPQERPVSLVYQAFVNYPNLTVSQNIESPLLARRLDPAVREGRIQDIAGKLQITELLNRLPHELSGGQQQRVAIARALAKDARVLLLDEPLANLDFKLREALESELRDLLTASQTIVIYTSSDPRDAFALGDRVLLLDRGQKLQSGSPIEVYRSPANLRAMELLADPFVNRIELDNVLYAIRPEHLEVDESPDGRAERSFVMLVTAFETSGDESYVHGRVEDQEWIVRCQGMQRIPLGSRLTLHARDADLMRF